ncbi:MAG: hypothetical protein Ta2C_04310 [Candidatus Endomicrobiellum trichonymphae]|uniref:hypothetical protein n=1 Tax=Endomicrobium trichonymphae TaxID=1408204 RepID=UPI0027D377F2|nr:MAG: hypothetical protein Ta2C_04310 [Candidatus Endomicrobium trichonymphae]
MKITASELEELVSGELIGDKSIVLTDISGLSAANEDDISRFKNKNVIKVSNPYYAYGIVLSIVEKENLDVVERNIHISASIADDVKLGKDAYIGQNVVIESGSEIGGNAKIFPNVCIIGVKM